MVKKCDIFFLYNVFIEQLNIYIQNPEIVNLYDRKFKFLQVYGTYCFNYWLLFKEGLTPVSLTLRLLKTD